MRATLTDAAIQKIKAPTSSYIEVWDKRIPAFGVRVRSTGRKSFVYLTRIDGKPKRYTLGSYPETSLAKARKDASAIIEQRDRGEIPTHAGPRQQTFGDVASAFIQRELKATKPDGSPKLKRGWEIERIIQRELMPYWQNRAWADLRKRYAYNLFDDLIDAGKPQAANKLHEIIRRVGRWASRRDMIATNPFADMDPPAGRVMRDRVLSHDEIREVWKACGVMKYPGGDFLKLCLLTGQRLSEVAGMTKDEVDLGAKTWTIPGSRTKNGQAMIVPLSAPARNAVKSLPKFIGAHLFTTTAGKVPISGFSKFKVRADNLSGVTGWTIHDLRRTARTLLAEVGIPQEIAERCLNHVPRNRLAQIYDRHHYSEPMRIAFEKLGEHIMGIVAPKPTGKIVKLRSA